MKLNRNVMDTVSLQITQSRRELTREKISRDIISIEAESSQWSN